MEGLLGERHIFTLDPLFKRPNEQNEVASINRTPLPNLHPETALYGYRRGSRLLPGDSHHSLYLGLSLRESFHNKFLPDTSRRSASILLFTWGISLSSVPGGRTLRFSGSPPVPLPCSGAKCLEKTWVDSIFTSETGGLAILH